MPSPRWRKILRDLWSNKRRTLLVVLSIAVGVFAVGAVAQMRVIVSEDMLESFRQARPASATIYTFDSFDDDLVRAIRRMPEVDEAQGRRSIVVRFQVEGHEGWYPLRLFALSDYDDVRIDIVLPEIEHGPDPKSWPHPDTFPPPDQAISIERTSLLLANHGLVGQARLGSTLLIEMPSGKQRKMPIVGLAFDAAHGPAPWMGMAYGYVTFETLDWLDVSRDYNELSILVAGDRGDKGHVERVARVVEDRVERGGVAVSRVSVPTPGKLPQDSLYQTLVLLLGALGACSLFVSAFLLMNTISALLTQQVRQIGVMKAVGARGHQLMGMYLSMVVVFGLLALVISAPLGAWAARQTINVMAYLINFNLGGISFPPQVLAVEGAMAIAVPLLAGLFPIVAGTRVTVREAITNYGLSGDQFGTSAIDRLVERLRGLPRPLLLSLRNTLRQKGRLALTMTTLTLAGAVFVSVASVRASLLRTLDELVQYYDYDVQVTLGRPYRVERLERAALSVPGVAKVEGWGSTAAYRVRPDDSEGEIIYIEAPPATTEILRPTMVSGRWLLPGDENALVISTNTLIAEPDIGLGDEIVLKIEDRDTTWRVVGIARFAQPVSLAFANYDYFTHVTRDAGRVSILNVITHQDDDEARFQVAEALEVRFEEAGIDVQSKMTARELRASLEVLFTIVIAFLMSMSVLLAVVGGIGLMGTMGLNVLERIREIGVMRAIGASNDSVLQIFVVEGVLIALLSWLIGTVLAIPMGKVLSNAVGMEVLRTPLTYTVPVSGILAWLVIVTVLAALASYLPARDAARLTVREVLSYER